MRVACRWCMFRKLIVAFLCLAASPATAEVPQQPDSMMIDCESAPPGPDARAKWMSLRNRSGHTIQKGSLLIVDASDGDHVVLAIGVDLKTDPGYRSNSLELPGTKKAPDAYTCTAKVVAPGKWKD